MSTPPVPDPYAALGLAKDATTQQVKAVYRKLALKYHPDKVTDEALKADASDKFHSVQQAYEILSDEDRRGRYDASVRLAELRKDVLERQSAKNEIRTAAYEMPTSSPGRATFAARGPERVTEERRPSKTYDTGEQDYFSGTTRATSRRNADLEREYRKYSQKDDSDRAKIFAQQGKENEKARRSDKTKKSDRERTRDRERKMYVEDDSDSDDGYSNLSSMRKRDEEREREYYDTAKRRKDQDDVRDYPAGDRSRKMSAQQDDARDYISRSGRGYAEAEKRPSASRVASSRDSYADVRRSPPPTPRPAMAVRRSSVRPPSSSGRESSKRSSGRDRERKHSAPEIEVIEPPSSRNRPVTLESHKSSPASIKIPGDERERRSQTMQATSDRPDYPSVPAQFRRSETMPNVSRKKDSAPRQSSNLRQTEFIDGAPPTPSTTPPYGDNYISSSNKYRIDEDERERYDRSNGRRTVVREPEVNRDSSRRMTRSPSPIRQSRSTSSRQQPPMLRTQTAYPYNPSTVESPTSYAPRPSPTSRRGSEQIPLYGEVPTTKRYEYPDPPREKDRYRYSPELENVSYQRKPAHEDVKMNTGYQIRRGSARPSLSRSTTYAQ